MRPRFSVVIPVRDRADVVGRAVASVLAQTFAGLEVVVVDDGSTDDSVAAARAVADGRVRIVRQEAAGLESARRSGASGALSVAMGAPRSKRSTSVSSALKGTRGMSPWRLTMRRASSSAAARATRTVPLMQGASTRRTSPPTARTAASMASASVVT